ncbi:MAG: hypothetical protein ACI97N_000970 [Cognaticolwellia sp.]|jgi:hypothetical protein
MKHVLFILLSFLLVNITKAQVTSISSINVGGSAFVGISLIAEQNNHGASELSFTPTPSYSGGVLVNVNWYQNLGIQIEGNYTFQGQKYYGTQSGIETEKNLTLNYIQIPVLFKYTFTEYSISKAAPDLFFMVGPQFAFLQNAKLAYLRGGTEIGFTEYHESVFNPLLERLPEYTTDIDLFNNFDLSLTAALGAQFEISDYLMITAESRLNWGVSDINARTWRFPDLRNHYTASRNYVWGLKIGIVGTIW